MKSRFSKLGFATAVFITLLSTGESLAQAQRMEVGRVIVAVDEFTAVQPDGAKRGLTRRSPVFSGDVLITGDKARGQVRFSDGSVISLLPSTEFRVDEFRFNGADDGSENAAFTLIKGGMRTITGVIGKKNQERYKIRTDVATIGIRGTHYLLRRCAGDCGDLAAGLYGGVVHGAIVVANADGQEEVRGDEFFYVRSETSGPELLPTPPKALFANETRKPRAGKPEGDGGAAFAAALKGSPESEPAASDVEGASRIATADRTLKPDTHLVPFGPTNETDYVSAPSGAVVGIAFVGAVGASDYDGGTFRPGQGGSDVALADMDGGDAVVLSKIFLPERLENDIVVPACNPCTLVATQGSLTDTGSVSGAESGINWGRWADGYTVSQNGTVLDTVGSLHYIYSPNETPYSTVRNMQGSYTYALVGGTSPTDESGAAGILSSANVGVDFTKQQIYSVSLSGSVGGKDFSATNSTSLAIAEVYQPGSAIALSGTCTGASCGTALPLNGGMSMSFVGTGAERMLSTYHLEQMDATTPVSITGTAALEVPSTVGVAGY